MANNKRKTRREESQSQSRNESLQAKHLSVLDASKMVKGLVDTLKNLRDSESSDVLSKAKDVAQKLDLEPVFSTKHNEK